MGQKKIEASKIIVSFKIQRWSNEIYIYIYISTHTRELVQKVGCNTINMRIKKGSEFIYIYRLIDEYI